MTGVVHIAGVHVQVGQLLRQRCAWCGAMLLDYNLAHLADLVVPEDQEGTPSVWPLGELVLVHGSLSAVVDHADGAPLPDNACGKLDPEVTR